MTRRFLPEFGYRRQPKIPALEIRSMPSPETNPNHARLADAELDGDTMTRADITEALRLLHFGRSNARHTVRIDGAVRDYLVEALQLK